MDIDRQFTQREIQTGTMWKDISLTSAGTKGCGEERGQRKAQTLALEPLQRGVWSSNGGKVQCAFAKMSATEMWIVTLRASWIHPRVCLKFSGTLRAARALWCRHLHHKYDHALFSLGGGTHSNVGLMCQDSWKLTHVSIRPQRFFMQKAPSPSSQGCNTKPSQNLVNVLETTEPGLPTKTPLPGARGRRAWWKMLSHVRH